MGCHEALHLASFFADAIDRNILSHPAIEAVPEWKELAQRSFEAMAHLYQKIGKKACRRRRSSQSLRATAASMSSIMPLMAANMRWVNSPDADAPNPRWLARCRVA